MKSKFEVKKLIEHDLNEVFDYLATLLTEKAETAFMNSVLILKSSYKDNEKLNGLGVITYDEYDRKLTRVKLNILNLIDDIPNQYFESTVITKSVENFTTHHNYTFLTISKLIRELVDIESAYNLNRTEILVRTNLNNKRTVLVNQVTKLINVHQFSLSGIEYQVIANAFYTISDFDKAQEFYQKAIKSIDEYTESAVTKITSIRNYADFLFKINQIDTATKQYETAILNVNSSQANLQNGRTLQMQFVNQIEHRMVTAAVESFKSAKRYYSNIENPTSRNLLIRELKAIWLNSHVLAGTQMPD